MLAGVQSTFNRLNGARGSHLGSRVNSIQMVWSERYTYDANGNIATKTTPYGTIHYTYDKENRLLTRGTVHSTYDEEGNLLEEESKDRYNKRYTYTGFNRIEVSDVLNHTDYTHTITGYRYDSFGRRVLTFEQDKPGMRSIYDGLTFEVLKEAETFLGTGNITSDLSGEANRFSVYVLVHTETRVLRSAKRRYCVEPPPSMAVLKGVGIQKRHGCLSNETEAMFDTELHSVSNS